MSKPEMAPKPTPKPKPAPKRKPARTPVNKAIESPENKVWGMEVMPAAAPKYWKYQGNALVPAMERFMRLDQLSERDVTLIRAYLWQWIESPAWGQNASAAGARALAELRAGVGKLRTITDIRDWVMLASEWGMDPT